MTTLIPKLEITDFPEDLAEVLMESKIKRLGYLGEFFKYTAHQPGALSAFIQFTEESKKGLSENIIELIALTVAAMEKNSYERNQHERFCVRSGLSREWVAAVNALEPAYQTYLSDEEKVLQEFVITTVRQHGTEVKHLLKKVVSTFGPKAAIAILMVIGRYLTHSIIVKALEIDAPVPSIFEDGFNG